MNGGQKQALECACCPGRWHSAARRRMRGAQSAPLESAPPLPPPTQDRPSQYFRGIVEARRGNERKNASRKNGQYYARTRKHGENRHACTGKLRHLNVAALTSPSACVHRRASRRQAVPAARRPYPYRRLRAHRALVDAAALGSLAEVHGGGQGRRAAGHVAS